MAKPFTEVLTIEDAVLPTSSTLNSISSNAVGGLPFSFELHRKQTELGDVSVDQFWMDIGSVYGRRNRRAENRGTIIDYYWALCCKEGSNTEEGVRDSYILAKLLPHTRNQGSRRVFADSVPTTSNRAGLKKRDLIAALDEELVKAATDEQSLLKFPDSIAAVLGPPKYDAEVREAYDVYEHELLADSRQLLLTNVALGLQTASQRWSHWMKSIGRHKGNEAKKQALDILSYECRAALHRCYSAVWCDLVPHLANKYAWSEETKAFHAIWHLDQCDEPTNRELTGFHLFQGHVFGLHPGAGLFIQTKTGSALMGEWLKNRGPGQSFQRLLHGLLIAMGDYARRIDLFAMLRKKEAEFQTGADFDNMEDTRHARPGSEEGELDDE